MGGRKRCVQLGIQVQKVRHKKKEKGESLRFGRKICQMTGGILTSSDAWIAVRIDQKGGKWEGGEGKGKRGRFNQEAK